MLVIGYAGYKIGMGGCWKVRVGAWGDDKGKYKLGVEECLLNSCMGEREEVIRQVDFLPLHRCH